ncbi:hypothetical protein [Verrucosispora sioxanthis]|uniref:hypothetical protein n=1 Tax=Verrucosispora sioxanthis TaxID=2499994 RepID=UPI001C100984|nr:hypothetical protein [Verrucosispora sioxanthis]
MDDAEPRHHLFRRPGPDDSASTGVVELAVDAVEPGAGAVEAALGAATVRSGAVPSAGSGLVSDPAGGVSRTAGAASPVPHDGRASPTTATPRQMAATTTTSLTYRGTPPATPLNVEPSRVAASMPATRTRYAPSSSQARPARRRRRTVATIRATTSVQATHLPSSGGAATGAPSPAPSHRHGPPTRPGITVDPSIWVRKVNTSPTDVGRRSEDSELLR